MNLSFEVVAGAIGASVLVSITSMSGMFALWIEPERLNRIIPYLVALAVGVLLGDAFIHLIPDAVKRQGSISTVCLTALSSLIFLLPVAAGGFIYIAATDLIPALHEHSTITNLLGQTAIFGLGIGFMQSIIILENTLLSQ